MDEKNNLPEEQTTHTESVETNAPTPEIPPPKTPLSKLPFIIGGVIAGVAAVAITVALVLGGGGNGNQGNGSAIFCKHNNPQKIEILPAKSPTCLETGLTEGKKCNFCGTVVVPQAVIGTIDCTEGDWIVDKEVTKTENGSRHTECTICGKTMSEETIPATGSTGLAYELKYDNKYYYTIVGLGTCIDTDINIPAVYNGLPVTSIGDNAFYDCDSLTSVIIPDSVTSIGREAFYRCSSLTSVVIGDSVTSIGGSAFRHCKNLTSIVIPDSVTTINDSAFCDCISLTNIYVSLDNTNFKDIDGNLYTKDGKTLIQYAIGKPDKGFTIPDNVSSIGRFAFYHCDNLTSITVDTGNEYYKSIDGNLYTKDGKTLIQYAIGKPDKEFTILDSVTTIGENAFAHCNNLTSIVIPDSVTSIGWGAFRYCDRLTSVVIGDSVTTISDEAFNGCESLTTIVIPDSVTIIDSCAFISCDSLSSIVIPDSVTTIRFSAFFLCDSLKDVYYTGSEAEWNAITIGSDNDELISAKIHYNYVPENNN